MRGISRAPFVAFLGVLVVLGMLGGRAAADEFIITDETDDGAGLFTPQAAPADQEIEPTPEELHAVPPAPRVVLNTKTRRAPRTAAISSRRTRAALTLLLAVQLNSPQFKVGLGSIPQAGASLGVFPVVAVAGGMRLQGTAPVRRHLAAQRDTLPRGRPADSQDPAQDPARDPTMAALFVQEQQEILLH